MSKREDNRARMPQTAAFVDLIRAEFPSARVVYARENGHEVGTPTPDVDYDSTEYARDVRRMRKWS